MIREHARIREGFAKQKQKPKAKPKPKPIGINLSVVTEDSQESNDSSSETDSLSHLVDVNDQPLHPLFRMLFRRRSPRVGVQITEVPTPLVNAALPVPQGMIREYHLWDNRPLPAIEDVE